MGNHWEQTGELAETYLRSDGAKVVWDSWSMKWIAYPPGQGYRPELKKENGHPRKWKTSRNAMAAVDREFPLSNTA